MRRSHSKESQEEAETKQSSKENIHQVRSSGQSRSKQQQQKSREPMVDYVASRLGICKQSSKCKVEQICAAADET